MSSRDGLIAYRVESARVDARVEEPSLVDAARALYPDAQVAPDPDRVRVRLLRHPDGSWRVRVPGGEWTDESPADALVHFELSVTDLLAAGIEEMAILHGGAATSREGALLVTGPGGSGKSSLTAALGRLGMPLFGDDVLLLDRATARLRPFPRLLRLRGRVRKVLELPDSPPPLDELWPEIAFLHPRDLDTRWAGPAPIRAVLYPRRDDGVSDPSLSPLGGGEGMRRLTSQLLMTEGAGPEDFDLLARALEGAELLELRFGRSDRAATLLRERFGGAPDPGA